MYNTMLTDHYFQKSLSSLDNPSNKILFEETSLISNDLGIKLNKDSGGFSLITLYKNLTKNDLTNYI